MREFTEAAITKPSVSVVVEPSKEAAEPPNAIVDRESQHWDAYFVGHEQIGYSHTTAEPVGGGDSYVQYTMEEQLLIRRGGQVTSQWLKQTSLESTGGIFQEFDSELSRGGAITLTHGKVGYNQLTITTRTGEQTTTHSAAWNSNFRGPFAVEQSLRARPMEPNEVRLIQGLLPVQNVVGTIRLQATDVINVAMLSDASAKLLEIECDISINNQPVLSRLLWANEQGELLKTYTPSVDFATFRVDQETATKVVAPKVDLLAATAISVAVDTSWETLRQKSSLTYRLHHQSQDPASLIESSPSQQIMSVDERTIDLVCVPIGSQAADMLPVDEADRMSNALIQSDHPTIRQMAGSLLVSKSATRTQQAETLRLAVNRHIRKKNFSRGFLSAAQVATEAEGDCTEHAILLAALCRAAGIPSRVAAGLLLLPPQEGSKPIMAYHMWTLYWTGQRWEAFDATMQQRPGFADRIMLISSNLASGNEYSCLLPVLQTMGQIDVQLVQ